MKIGILQLNLVVGDCAGNAKKILKGYHEEVANGAELVVGTELMILGYPPKDLLDYPWKVDEQLHYLDAIREEVGSVGLMFGAAEWNEGDGKPLFNNVVFVVNKEIIGRKTKELLPNYDVFDEDRYFERGPAKACIVAYRGKRLGVMVCEDSWRRKSKKPRGHNLYAHDPVEDMIIANPDIVIIINASPYYWGKGDVRFDLVGDIAKRIGRPVVYVNPDGANDELIFDGRSFGVRPDGTCFGYAWSFVDAKIIFDTESLAVVECSSDTDDCGELYRSLVLGVRDYAKKTGFTKAILGESGGIDSALTTCIAVDALGAENVTAIGMPSSFSSRGSVTDSVELCRNLGVDFYLVPIGEIYNSFGDALSDLIGWHGAEAFGRDVTEENVQAGIRGRILMAYSNRTGALVLSTGNKSELSVGYCTLYGDMVGGLAVISDLPKTVVYRLARWLNSNPMNPQIPAAIIDKVPSAELRPGQKDQDSLPPYDILDAILHLYVEERLGRDEIIAQGFDREVVVFVTGKVDGTEYKRKQAAPGLKATSKAFGSGRRLPIATKPASD